MKLVVALGGNALLRRDQAPTADNQLENIRRAATQLAIARALAGSSADVAGPAELAAIAAAEPGRLI